MAKNPCSSFLRLPLEHIAGIISHCEKLITFWMQKFPNILYPKTPRAVLVFLFLILETAMMMWWGGDGGKDPLSGLTCGLQTLSVLSQERSTRTRNEEL